MDLNQSIEALDSIARQKKANQSKVEKILDDLLRGAVENANGGKTREGKPQD